ncbi:helix-turn-helix transcriptional regulator [Streptomyces sp. NPDC021562]
MARLEQDVAYDAFCFGTIDPWTLLLTDDVSDGIPPGSGALASHHEHLVPDVDKFSDLARTGRTVGILSHSSGGDPGLSARFRSVLPIFDARHELRAVFMADGECWGALAMFRHGDRADFTPREASLVRALSRPVATALRRASVNGPEPTSSGPTGPGVVVSDAEGRTLAANDTARRWLDEISVQALHEVSAAARAGRGEEAYLRVRSRTGRWLSLWGSPLDGEPHAGAPAGMVSVSIQPTPTAGITEILTLVYALTAREREILQQVISGRSSTGIASVLSMSPYTVQDHLKSIFSKFGVRSRGELVARALGIQTMRITPH